MSVSEDESNSHEGANDKCDDKPPPVIRTSPEVLLYLILSYCIARNQ